MPKDFTDATIWTTILYARSLIARSILRNRMPVGNGSCNAVSGSLTSSSATLNGRAKCGTQFRQVAVTSWMCQHAAKGWLQRLVRLYRLLVRESHRAIWGVIYFGSNCEATLMIGRIQREGFDLAGIYLRPREG